MKCGACFQAKELGEGLAYRSRVSYNTHVGCLERARLRPSPLPSPVETQWKRRKLAYARECCFKYTVTTGSQFLNKIPLVVAELGAHSNGQLSVEEKLSDREKTSLKKYQEKWDYKRPFEDFVIGLGA